MGLRETSEIDWPPNVAYFKSLLARTRFVWRSSPFFPRRSIEEARR